MLKILELFGGIRACSKALECLGIDYECVDYVEIDSYAVASANAIFGTNFLPQDICSWNKFLDVDLIMHGSPCQDFSVAGLGKGGDEGSGTRSSLMYETVRIVKMLKPKYILWENVKNAVCKNHIHNFNTYLDRLVQLGYNNYYRVLNSIDYGIPQHRERIFCISIRKDIDIGYTFPKPFELNLRLKDMLEFNVAEKYFLSDSIVVHTLSIFDNICFDIKSKNGLLIPLYKDTKLLRETIEFNNLYVGHPLSLDLYNRSAREYSQTLTAPNHNTHRLWDGFRIRKFTPKECWRLMGFSDFDYEKAAKVNSPTQLYKQAANSIVVNVLVCLLKNLFL